MDCMLCLLIKAHNIEINDYNDTLGPYLQRKGYVCVAMIVMICLVWMTVSINFILKQPTTNAHRMDET